MGKKRRRPDRLSDDNQYRNPFMPIGPWPTGAMDKVTERLEDAGFVDATRPPAPAPTQEEQLLKRADEIGYDFVDDPEYIERFALEQWVGQRTNHPNLARILRPKGTPSCLYHVMEFIEGRPLDAWLAAEDRSIPEITAVIRQVIDGTRALHRRETLHQDLKPDNILVTGEGVVKLIDYGSVRIAGIAEISAPVLWSLIP